MFNRISCRRGNLFTSWTKVLLGLRFFSSLPKKQSDKGQTKPRSEGIREDRYSASSSSIPFGYLSERYPRQAIFTAALDVTVPYVQTCTHPN